MKHASAADAGPIEGVGYAELSRRGSLNPKESSPACVDFRGVGIGLAPRPPVAIICPRVDGTVHEVVAVRFAREAPTLQPLPARRYDTAYWEARQVSWDAYVDVRGNRYSVPAAVAGRPVRICITLDGALAVYDGEQCIARHVLQPAAQGWATVPDHHAALWADTLAVERRPLTVYEEVATWS
ncbi:MAG TPA: hypothetical protein VJ717_01275 [Gemmatimonadaceae bacterium]|nr:hypothetical protein [Gemmatimonadaceae bacterium]